ncbi:MAG: hypothetical protein DDT19_01693 [Syntrophomonadaceae bacterium]|nr:hypothetical protein [Bacillota bacterium]
MNKAKYLSPRFRVRADLDKRLAYLSIDAEKSKQALAEEALIDLLRKYQNKPKSEKNRPGEEGE